MVRIANGFARRFPDEYSRQNPLFSFSENQVITLYIHTEEEAAMALEKGIDKLVQDFIAAGRPSSLSQNIDERRAGYVASTVLAGE